MEKSKLIIDMIHRLIVHHGFWFEEVRRQMGKEKAFELFTKAFEKSFNIQIKRLAKFFGVELQDGLPKALIDMPEEKKDELLKIIGINWLVNDGVWFQTIENSAGMNDAKRCNDSCWGQFSPFEAMSIKKLLNLPEKAGLDGLKEALGLRLYSRINKQKIVDETETSFTFQMTECRVQVARKRKGLTDYPCKSAGLVEYPYFAQTIDKRIKTECIGCPPDKHPEEWFCAWKFILE